MKTETQITPLLVNSTMAAQLCGMGRSFFLENVATGRIMRPQRWGRKRLWSVEALSEMVRKEVEKQKRGTA